MEREQLRAQITLKEINTPTSSMYQSVGKMFIVSSPDDVKAQLMKSLELAAAQLESIKVNASTRTHTHKARL